jgi:2,4-dienoyl-CoA reductase-like NADH-dependent reductase (Old Yellow Enzyme family)
MSNGLFTPIRLRQMTLANRIVVAPMCQYSAIAGSATEWHLQHLGSLALSCAGLLMIEATAVEARGRITPHCLGLYSIACEQALATVLQTCRVFGTARIGIQLAHAGRKASVHVPWQGSRPLGEGEGAWEAVAPSARPFAADWPMPRPLDGAAMARIKGAFVAAAERAARLGIDVAELHCAHGYLLHEFLSPLANHRTDKYGGSLDNRMRYPLEVAAAVREVWPAERPLGLRVSATDWLDGGFTIDEAVVFAGALRALGLDYVCVSSGGIVPESAGPPEPGYQVPLARRIRDEAAMPVRAVGLIAHPRQADAVIRDGSADMVALARAFLDDPRWVWHAAEALGETVPYPPQYQRCRPGVWPGAPLARGNWQAADGRFRLLSA